MLAVCAALQWEVRPVLRSLSEVRRAHFGAVRVWQGRANRLPVLVFRTGIGVERAAASTCAVLERFKVTGIINSGCAGALTADLAAGDLIIPERLIFAGDKPGPYATDPTWSQRLRAAARSAGLPETNGAIVTSPVVLATPAAKQAAADCHGAIAVEMEGTAVAEIAVARGLPFASVRAVLDVVAADLPTTAGFMGPDGSFRPLRAAYYVLRKPAAVPDLVALAAKARTAESSLDRLFRAFVRDSVPAGTEFDD